MLFELVVLRFVHPWLIDIGLHVPDWEQQPHGADVRPRHCSANQLSKGPVTTVARFAPQMDFFSASEPR
jgi:hypothetical protein